VSLKDEYVYVVLKNYTKDTVKLKHSTLIAWADNGKIKAVHW